MITDQEILSYFLKSNGHVNVQRLNKISDEYRNYLENRYTDSQSLRETIKRIQYNIEIRPVYDFNESENIYEISRDKYY